MKNIVSIIAIALLVQVTGYAQEDISVKPKKDYNDPVSSVHEIGINATFFISTFFSFNSTTPSLVSPYALTYKYRKGKGALRFGVGGSYRATDQGSDGNIFTTSNSGADVRLGGEYSLPFGNRWRSFFGGDAVFSYTNSSSSSSQIGNSVTTDITGLGFGGGPVIGLDFMIAKRIKIGTETSVMFKRTERVQQSFFDGTSIPGQEDRSTVTEVVFNLPTSLYLIIML